MINRADILGFGTPDELQRLVDEAGEYCPWLDRRPQVECCGGRTWELQFIVNRTTGQIIGGITRNTKCRSFAGQVMPRYGCVLIAAECGGPSGGDGCGSTIFHVRVEPTQWGASCVACDSGVNFNAIVPEDVRERSVDYTERFAAWVARQETPRPAARIMPATAFGMLR